MIFILIGVSIVLICALLIAVIKITGKPLGYIVAIIRYEIIYNILGAQALLDDYIYKDKHVSFDQPVGTDKFALITGGNRGIGYEIVKKLVKCDFQAIIGCRNMEEGNKVLEKIRSEGIKTGNVYVYKLDLASLASIRSFAAEVKQNHPKIHLLINNAGKMFGPYIETVDSFESQFATNYLSHFLLTHLLLPEIKAAGTLKQAARIINVSSCAHVVGEIDFNDINQRVQYIPSKVYAQSKLAQILFSNYLNTILQAEEAHVTTYSIHPGIVDTGLFDNTYLKQLAPWIPSLFFMTPEQGAATAVFASLSPTIEKSGGIYISNCQTLPTSDLAYSTILQTNLFEFTCKLLKIEQFGRA